MKTLVVISLLFFSYNLTSGQTPFWQQTNGPEGASVGSIITVDGTIMIGAGSVFASTDGGGTWVEMGAGLTESVQKLFIKDMLLFAGGAYGLFRSTDLGRNWQMIGNGIFNYHDFGSFARLANSIYVASYGGGVYRSTNDGATWAGVNTGLGSRNVKALASFNTRLFAGTYGAGLFVSTNGGTSWSPVVGVNNSNIFSLGVYDSVIYVGTGLPSVCRSYDGGETWAESPGVGTVQAFAFNGVYVFAAGCYGLSRTSNRGASWTNHWFGFSQGCANAMGFINGILYMGTTYGVYRSTDAGLGWTLSSAGLRMTHVTDLVSLGERLFAGTQMGPYVSTNNGDSWISIRDGLGPNIFGSRFACRGDTLYLGNGDGVWSSIDYGATWSHWNTRSVQSLVAADSFLYGICPPDGVVRAPTSGGYWVPVNGGLPSLSVYALGRAGATLFVQIIPAAIYRSVDGVTWIPAINGVTNSLVNDFGSVGGTIFAATDGEGVYRSTNNGDDWIQMNTGLTSLYIGRLSSLDSLLFATDEYAGDVFLSTDLAEHWVSVSAGLPDVPIDDVSVKHPFVYVGTDGRGVWKRPLSDIVSVPEGTAAPRTLVLSQNFPNPFNPSTIISFSIPRTTFTTLKIYNTLGQEIATLVSENLTPGTYSRPWDASSVASGVYYYRLTSGEFTQTGKLLLLR